MPSKIYIRGSCGPRTPLRKTFYIQNEYLFMSKSAFNFSVLALVVSEIIWRSQIYITGGAPSGRPLAEKFLYHKRAL